jgi:hypothetical protein
MRATEMVKESENAVKAVKCIIEKRLFVKKMGFYQKKRPSYIYKGIKEEIGGNTASKESKATRSFTVLRSSLGPGWP